MALPTSLTQFFNPLNINWSVALVAACDTQCVAAGTSSNPVYVTLANNVLPAAAGPVMLTYVKLAVGSGGAINQATALASTWAQFSTGGGPANVTTWDGRSMQYYTAGFGSCAYTAQYIVENVIDGTLTYSPSAQCGAFALLLQSALAMNGIHSNFINVFATDYYNNPNAPTGVVLAIKNWTTGNPSYPPSQSPWSYQLVLNADDYMSPARSNYGDLTNQTGIPGQGEPPPATPVEKVFHRHFIVQVVSGTAGCTDYNTLSTSQLYDPSYGVTYLPAGATNTTMEGFERQAVYGFAAQIPSYGDQAYGPNWHFRLPLQGQPDISFQCVAANSM
jgi:hypothetical protein